MQQSEATGLCKGYKIRSKNISTVEILKENETQIMRSKLVVGVAHYSLSWKDTLDQHSNTCLKAV